MKTTLTKLLPCLVLPVLLQPVAASAESCAETLKTIESLYNNTVDKCRSGPASNCSGLLIRGTHRSPDGKYDVWNPSPKAQELGTFAASWMRADGISYEDPGLKTNNGYLIMPFDKVEKPETPVHVYCAFPNDAWTDFRDDNGCGDNKNTPSTQEPVCQSMKPPINDAAGWLALFIKYQRDKMQDQYQCGFNMRGNGEAANQARTLAFQQFIKARQAINTREFQTQTELRLGNPKTDELPILAFFYSDPRGLGDAKKNAADYKAKTGKDRNIVKIDFPKTPNGKARFSCLSPDPTPPESQYCKKYIASSEWIQRDDPELGPNTWSLQVVPTDCGRKISKEQTARMWAELYNKHKDDAQWREYSKNGGSMRRQMVCHLTLVDDGRQVRDKPVWNLEPARPYVDHETALKMQCNPY
ncbi:DUF2599 domain-containing protein [Pseudomonas xantholysinigenes]|uniref:DUF2599 domain-containing protein n=1 Tax=Pseudomonas xantholysinigenes TaxID=2745490 RepID=A0A9E6PZX2_9PSED|nr:DUF2599 domain-containing protein [Pseudomonas xantholysinigenes]QXI40650.1 DUF2599 domain-containing protein [Pseudomonas xantholysinigenes]